MAQWIDILLANNHTYDNSTSGLAASDVKAALDELAAAGGTPSAGGASWPVTQAAHGFSVGDPIYFDGTDWVLAQADSVDHVHVGVVSAVADVDTFTITLAGTVSGLSGLTPGTWYYLSQDTAGALVDTTPTSGVKAAVLQATSATTAIVVPYIPQDDSIGGLPSLTVSGTYEVIDSQTASADSELIFALPSGGYDDIHLNLNGLTVSTDSTIYLQVSDDDQVSFESASGDYRWSSSYGSSSGADNTIGSTSDTEIQVGGTINASSAENGGGRIRIIDHLSTSRYKLFMYEVVDIGPTTTVNHRGMGEFRGNTNALTGFRIYPNTGTFSGTIELVGRVI